MSRTQWRVLPSFRFDTLCLLNILTGDPFYLQFNQETYDTFKERISPEATTSLANLKRIIKDEGQSIISAMLCLYFSGIVGESLMEMQAALDNPSEMQAKLKASPYYDEANWQIFLSSRDDLGIIFRFLESIDFPNYWQTVVLPELEQKIETIAAYLPAHDVVARLEEMIGQSLPSPEIRVYVLHYTRPHGIKVIGQRFLTAASWNPQIVLRTAIHEMLHPPYEIASNPALKAAIEALEQDPFVHEKFSNHNPDFGYNSFSGYVEENCVRALEQLVNESFGIGRNPQERWREEDDGMHVVAAALYHTMKSKGLRGTFADFLLEALHDELAVGKVQAVYDAFYSLTE
jgi:hypothetical protein